MAPRATRSRFLVDGRGRPEAVVLPLSEYRRLLENVENRSEAKALMQAIRTSRGTISHSKLLERLKRQGLL